MKRALLCLLLLLCRNALKGQFYFYDDHFYDRPLLIEGGLSAGYMNCFTDLGGKAGKNFFLAPLPPFGSGRAAYSVYGALRHQYWLSCFLEAGLGQVAAFDSLQKGRDASSRLRRDRNLHFRSRIADVRFMLACCPLVLIKSHWQNASLQPYLSAGLGFFLFEPQARWGNRWINLAPLRTEGQGFPEYPQRHPYSLQQWMIPAALGFRWEAGARWTLHLEICHRFLFTDYLDDVSSTYINPDLFWRYLPPGRAELATWLADRGVNQLPAAGQRRGNNGRKDSYFSCQLKAGWVFNRLRR